MPAPAPVMSKRMGADRKNSNGGQTKRRPQGGQGSDTDSGIYQVKSHMLVQRRQPPAKFNRPARDTYFDKVLNNSEESCEESSENDSCYICDDCRNDEEAYICRKCRTNAVEHRKQSPPPRRYNKQDQNVGRGPNCRRPQYAPRRRDNPYRDKYFEEDEDESLTEDELAPQTRRISSRQPNKIPQNGGLQRNRQQPHPHQQQKQHLKPEVSDRPQISRAPKQSRPRHFQRENSNINLNRREPLRARRDQDFSDFGSNDDEYISDASEELQPHQRQGNGRRKQSKRSLQNDAPPRRGKQQQHYREVVERKTTTRQSRQNDEDVRIRRQRVFDDYSSESRTEASEQSDNSEATYEHIEMQRRNTRRPIRKEIYEENEPVKPQSRAAAARPRTKAHGPMNGSHGRRMSANAEPRMRSMGVRAANVSS